MPSAPSVIVVVLLVVASAGTPTPRTDAPASTVSPPRPRAPRVERPEPAPVIHLGSGRFDEGDVLRSVTTSNSALHTSIYSGGELVQEFDQFEDRSVDKSMRVLACDANGPSRWRLDYHARRFLARDDGSRGDDSPSASAVVGGAEAIAEKDPLDHQSFLLVRNGRALRVLDVNEKLVDEGLAQIVLQEECVRGDEVRQAGCLVARELAGRTLPIGIAITCSEDTSRAFVDGRENLDHTSLVLTPREDREEHGRRVALFDARLSLNDGGDAGQPPTSIDLSGELRLDVATGRFLGIEMTGILSLGESKADQTRAVEMVGQGTWTIRETVTYSRVP